MVLEPDITSISIRIVGQGMYEHELDHQNCSNLPEYLHIDKRDKEHTHK